MSTKGVTFSFGRNRTETEANKLWSARGKPGHWAAEQGSVLDKECLDSLGKFDIFYSWGVLHHTGEMWNAVKNYFGLVGPGRTVWIALYQKG